MSSALPITYFRYKNGEPFTYMVCGPKQHDHPSVGTLCLLCNTPFNAGEYTTLIPLGPGDDPEERERCADNRWYSALALEVHYVCATGKMPELPQEDTEGEAPGPSLN